MPAMPKPPRAFSAIELVIVAVVLSILIIIVLPVMNQRWNADAQKISLNYVRQILAACAEYRLDHAERVPMRACGYSNGQISGGWDTWNFAGKNCDFFWSSSVFDESAYGRFLNPYLQANEIPRPPGYFNTGSGATWNFNDGVPTVQQRVSFQMKVCRSPGDINSRQRTLPFSGMSSYDDVGTSYHLNMHWWQQTAGSFTLRYDTGTQAISAIQGAFGVRRPSDFAWISDQVGTAVPNMAMGTIQGEFGGDNMSVVGYLDGRSAYIPIVNNALQGPGYTLLPW